MGVRESAVDLFSGSAGGTAVVLVGQPMDTIKVKMQTFGHMYSGIANCFVRTVRTDGVFRGLYAGTTPALVAYISENSVLFAALGLTQKLVARACGVSNVDNSNELKDRRMVNNVSQRSNKLVLYRNNIVSKYVAL